MAYHREPQVLRESVTAEGMLIVRDNEEAQALEMSTIHKPLLTSTLHGYLQHHCRSYKIFVITESSAFDVC